MTTAQSTPGRYLTGKIISRNETHVIIEYTKPVRAPYRGGVREIPSMKMLYSDLKRYELPGDQFRAPVEFLIPHIKKHLDILLDQEMGAMLESWDRADDARDEQEVRKMERTRQEIPRPRIISMDDVEGKKVDSRRRIEPKSEPEKPTEDKKD
jgi:hypothetical protein